MKVISTEIKNLEPIKTVAIPHVGSFSGICSAFDKLAVWAGTNNLWRAMPKMVGVYGDPTGLPEDQWQSKAALEDLTPIELPEGMERYTVSGGKYFVVQVEVLVSEYGEAWEKAMAQFAEKGYEYDMRDHYELYVSCGCCNQADPDAPWIVDICLPMK